MQQSNDNHRVSIPQSVLLAPLGLPMSPWCGFPATLVANISKTILINVCKFREYNLDIVVLAHTILLRQLQWKLHYFGNHQNNYIVLRVILFENLLFYGNLSFPILKNISYPILRIEAVKTSLCLTNTLYLLFWLIHILNFSNHVSPRYRLNIFTHTHTHLRVKRL